jgi:hypothetical protein
VTAGTYHVRVSPRPTLPRLIPLIGALALLSACGEPPQPLPTSPPRAMPSPSLVVPSLPLGQQPLPPLTGYPTNPYPVLTTTPPTTVTVRPTPTPTTKSPSPTPSHASRCTGQPTGPQILAELKEENGVPKKPLRVFEGPFCSGTWSFTTVEVIGRTEDQVEPLMVVATGAGSTLDVVAAGSDVCVARVESEAPPGVRVLACGF